MTDLGRLRAGLLGTAITAVCCFTPALVLLLGVAGLSSWLGWIDYVLWPALLFFMGLTVHAYWRHRGK